MQITENIFKLLIISFIVLLNNININCSETLPGHIELGQQYYYYNSIYFFIEEYTNSIIENYDNKELIKSNKYYKISSKKIEYFDYDKNGMLVEYKEYLNNYGFIIDSLENSLNNKLLLFHYKVKYEFSKDKLLSAEKYSIYEYDKYYYDTLKFKYQYDMEMKVNKITVDAYNFNDSYLLEYFEDTLLIKRKNIKYNRDLVSKKIEKNESEYEYYFIDNYFNKQVKIMQSNTGKNKIELCKTEYSDENEIEVINNHLYSNNSKTEYNYKVILNVEYIECIEFDDYKYKYYWKNDVKEKDLKSNTKYNIVMAEYKVKNDSETLTSIVLELK